MMQTHGLLVAALVIAGLNMRAAITSAGPLMGAIRDHLGLLNWSVSLITTLPLIAFAATSPVAPRFGRRFGNERTVLGGLILLLAGISIRSIPSVLTVFTGTAIIGVGIAIMNVLMPAIVKEWFPDKIGAMTSVYTSTMSVFAGVASGLALPLADGLTLGWQLSLLAWAIIAVAGIVFWLPIVRLARGSYRIDELAASAAMEVAGPSPAQKPMWRSAIAWQITLFMGMHSWVFYSLVTWLPEMLMDLGFPSTTGGWLLFYMQFVGVPSTFIAPRLADRYTNQQLIALVINVFLVVGLCGLWLSSSLPALIASATLAGIGSGAGIGVALTLIGKRSRDSRQARELSGMANTFGYLLAAIGPVLIGTVYDLSATWSLSMVSLIVAGAIGGAAGVGAGRNKYVLD